LNPVSLFKRKLFGYLFTGFFCGVLLGNYLFDWEFVPFLFLFIGSGLMIFSTIKRKSEASVSLFLISFFVLALGSGVLRERWSQIQPSAMLETKIGDNVSLYGRVISPSISTSKSSRSVLAVGENKVLIQLSDGESVEYGDVVLAKGKLTHPENFLTESGREFDYRSYLAKDGVLYVLNFTRIEQRLGNEGDLVKRTLFNIKRSFLGKIQTLLPSDEGDLLSGILLGEIENKGLEESFRSTGLSHILVLSGYNIAVVMVLIGALFNFLPRRIRMPLVILSIIAFTVMVSSGSSTVRAAIMACAVVLARMSDRKISVWRSLFLAVFVMIVANPHIIFHDPGFQLSFLATSGLVVFGDFFSRHLGFITTRFGLREVVAMSLSAQVAVWPLLVHTSGAWSIVSVPANLLILPTVAPAMFFGFITLIISYFWVPGIFLFPANFLLGYMITTAEILSRFSYAEIQVPQFNGWYVVMCYVLFSVFYLRFYQKRTRLKIESFNNKMRMTGLFNREHDSRNLLPRSAN
jgi:competence protein ComEC